MATPGESDLGGVPSWYREIFPAGPNDGFFLKRGVHSLSFVDRGKHQLVVSFDNLSDAGNRRYDREPWGGKFLADSGWSHLGIYSQVPHWFRDQGLIEMLEKLKSDGFFGQFERVAFCGTSMGGFGALTFSGLSPGATVIAFSPQTTLNEGLVPWETRFAKGRAADWSLPYSDAAEQTGAAARIYVVHDPFHVLDRKHFERLRGANVIGLRGFGLGHKSALLLRKMDVLKPIMSEAFAGTLSEQGFYRMIRARKNIYLYRQNIEAYLAERGLERWIPMFRSAFKARRKAGMNI